MRGTRRAIAAGLLVLAPTVKPRTPSLAEAVAFARAPGLVSDPTAVSWGPGRIDVFGRGGDNALWHRWYDGGQWSGWESLGGSLASGPDVASWGSGRLDVFARGTDNTLVHKWYEGGWSGWESLGGGLASDPSAVSWGPGRLDVFARGADNALWHKSYEKAWSGWESLGGSLASGPDACSWGTGRLDIFARGADNTLVHKWYAGSWSGWESLGGGLTADPGAVSTWGSSRIDVFVRGGDNALWQRTYDKGWLPWQSRGGGLSSGPDASSWGSGRLDVFALGTDANLYHLAFNGSWSAWELLGTPTLTTATTLKTIAPLAVSTATYNDLTHQPPGTYPPVSLAITPYNPSLHQVTWDWDGTHGFSYFQVYKLDPASPSGRLVRDKLTSKGFLDTAFVAPNTTTYRVVGYHADGTWGSADIGYPNPPQPQAPSTFTGQQVGTGAVKFSYQTMAGGIRYRLYGPTLPSDGVPIGGIGVSSALSTYTQTGIPIGTQTFAMATEYLAGVAPARTSTSVLVKPTSGNYRVLVKSLIATHETNDDPLSMDGRGDEIYAAAYWALLPNSRGYPVASGLVQTKVYGDIHQAPDRIQAGTASNAGGIRSSNSIPDYTAPMVQPGIAAYTDRLPLLVWQGTLSDNGQVLVINPQPWESDNNPTFYFSSWPNWWTTPNGRGILMDIAYANQAVGPLKVVWIGEFDETGKFPMQPGMDVSNGHDRPVGIGGLVLEFVDPLPNSNSMIPRGVVLTRERIELALGNANAVLVPMRYPDRLGLDGDYWLYLQIERVP